MLRAAFFDARAAGQFYILPDESPMLSITYMLFEMKNVEQVEEVEAHLQTLAKD